MTHDVLFIDCYSDLYEDSLFVVIEMEEMCSHMDAHDIVLITRRKKYQEKIAGEKFPKEGFTVSCFIHWNSDFCMD